VPRSSEAEVHVEVETLVDLQRLPASRCAVDVEVVAEPVVRLGDRHSEPLDGAFDVGDLVVDGDDGGSGSALVFGLGGGLALLPPPRRAACLR